MDSHGLKRLYISIDNPDARYSNWKNTVEDFRLGGYHVLAGPDLESFLMDKFGWGGAILVPQYFIIENGKVIIDPAPVPGREGELKNLLNEINEGDE